MNTLYKQHKTKTKYNWKKLGIKIEDYNYWYNRYINSTNCELCNSVYKNNRDRQLDHNHENGLPRNIICIKCNRRRIDNKQYKSKLGLRYITKNGNQYEFNKWCCNQSIFRIRNKNLNKINWIKFSYLLLNKKKFYS